MNIEKTLDQILAHPQLNARNYFGVITVQRMLNIGYNLAARALEYGVKTGFISHPNDAPHLWEVTKTGDDIYTCIGCGCDDHHACIDEDADAPCRWIRIDKKLRLGLCSCCKEHIRDWDGGDRFMRVPGDNSEEHKEYLTIPRFLRRNPD